MHWTKGIKNLIFIQVLFEVSHGERPRDLTGGRTALSLAVDDVFSQEGGPGVCARVFAHGLQCARARVVFRDGSGEISDVQ